MTRVALLRCLVAGAAVAGGSWLFGVQGARPILLGVCTAAVVATFMTVPAGRHPRWPHQPGSARGGGTTKVWRLANRFSSLVRRSGGADSALQNRLRRLAIARLGRHGIAWNDSRAGEVLGTDVYRALTAPNFHPDVDELERVVSAVENADPTATGGHAS